MVSPLVAARVYPGRTWWRVLFAAGLLVMLVLGSGMQAALASHHPEIYETDDAGPDDEQGSTDLNALSVDVRHVSTDGLVWVSWSWDVDVLPAGEQAHGCAIFESDGDGRANYMLCVSWDNSQIQLAGSPVLYVCSNFAIDHCGGSPSMRTLSTNTSCSISNIPDGFGSRAGAQASTDSDTLATCSVNIADVDYGALINICSYQTNQPTSSPSDCIYKPDETAFLVILKDAGGDTATPFHFSLNPAARNGATLFTATGRSSSIPIRITAGATYTLAESQTPAGWRLQDAQCNVNGEAVGTFNSATGAISGLSAGAGQGVVCLFTSVPQGTVRFEKQVIGGSAQPDEWTFDIVGGPQRIAHNASVVLDTGSYLVTESGGATAQYQLTGASGACTLENGQIRLDVLQQDSVCTVTNSALPGEIIIAVKTTPGGASQSFTFTPSYNGGVPFTLRDSQSHHSGPLAPGTYSVKEILPAGWSQTGATCSDGSLPAQLLLDPAETITCAFENSEITAPVVSPRIEASMHDMLVEALDGDGAANPGEYIDYVVVIRNSGGASSALIYSDLPGDNTVLVNGSVIASQGSVVHGNLPGDTNVQVDLGDVAPQSAVTVTYRVHILDPLPAGVTKLVNQGVVSGDLPDTLTDDPDTPVLGDPTETPVAGARPVLSVVKTDKLLVDRDQDNVAGPGDILEYLVTVRNNGGQTATGVQFVDQLDSNTLLLAGSVQASRGIVVKGNGASDTRVEVDIGALDRDESVAILFQAVIQESLATTVTRLRNQAIVTSVESPPVLSDDTDTQQPGDATLTPVSAMPVIVASMEAVLLVDQDNNSVASPGDTLGYRVTIFNNGSVPASGVVYTAAIDSNTTLLDGSLRASLGTIVSGASSDDQLVQVDIGALDAGSQVTISYHVIVRNPWPHGVFEVVNQGVVQSNEGPDEPTDDPNQPGAHDPTIVPITAAARLQLTKRAALFNDADGNKEISPGDTLIYLITVANLGNTAASDVKLIDIPDTKTSLVNGSVQTNQGIVASGNSSGDAQLEVLIGTLAPNTRVTVGFKVAINPDAGTQIVNQALVRFSDPGLSGTSPIELASDDPDTAQENDPTVIVLVNAPSQEDETPNPDPAQSPIQIFLPWVDR